MRRTRFAFFLPNLSYRNVSHSQHSFSLASDADSIGRGIAIPAQIIGPYRGNDRD
jgi:hypothetical protein